MLAEPNHRLQKVGIGVFDKMNEIYEDFEQVGGEEIGRAHV